MKKINLTGQKFGRLLVLNETDPYISQKGWKKSRVLCKCDCGTVKKILQSSLKNGRTKSCGCLSKEIIIKRSTKHGYNKLKKTHSLYELWKAIKSRCYYKGNIGYKSYGGRGITICKEWINNPKTFIEWALNNGWKKGLEIDRINNDGNYEPNNCRFTNRSINCINQRIKKNNTSGYTGIQWNKSSKKWQSSLIFNKNFYYLGIFKNKQQAVESRNRFIILWNLPHKIQYYIQDDIADAKYLEYVEEKMQEEE